MGLSAYERASIMLTMIFSLTAKFMFLPLTKITYPLFKVEAGETTIEKVKKAFATLLGLFSIPFTLTATGFTFVIGSAALALTATGGTFALQIARIKDDSRKMTGIDTRNPDPENENANDAINDILDLDNNSNNHIYKKLGLSESNITISNDASIERKVDHDQDNFTPYVIRERAEIGNEVTERVTLHR